MPELIEELRPVLHVLALRINGDLRVTAGSALPDLIIDRLSIQHVLFALTQNAVDASTEMSGLPSVWIDVSADRNAVHTSVTDSGPGVPAELEIKYSARSLPPSRGGAVSAWPRAARSSNRTTGR